MLPSWVTLTPGVNLIKLFSVKLFTLFEKLEHFINVTIIIGLVKRYSFPKRVSKFTPKMFYEIECRCPGVHVIKLFSFVTKRPNNIERLSLTSVCHCGLMFAGETIT